MLTSCIPKIIIQSDTHQLMTFLPTPDFPNPNTEKVDLLIQHFPLIRYTVEQNRQITQKHIHPFLFAYREVPNEATEHSPFELLYGREVRGSLEPIIIRQSCVEGITAHAHPPMLFNTCLTC